MGSSGSKPHCGGGASSSSSSSSSGGWSGRSKSRRVFQSSCLGSSSGSRDADVDEQVIDNRRSKECGSTGSGGSRNKGERDEVKSNCYGKVEEGQSDDGLSCASPDDPIDEWHQARITSSASGTGSSSSRASSSRFISGSSRILSRFSFVPGNVSFRLSRASSLGSSRAYPVRPTSFAILNDDDIEVHQASGRCDTQNSSGLRFDIPESNCLDDVTRTSTFSSLGEATDSNCAGVGVDVNLHSPRIFHEVDGIETRISDRRMGAREPAERNARFSRTLSVGRLRDRVLRHSSLSEQPFCPQQQQGEVIDAPQDADSQAIVDAVVLADASSISGHTTTPTSGFSLDFQDHEVEASRSRENRYHDLLEHRSNFLERRRRVRSQVRALQRLGSRFENLSGHDRSCILSGQHRTGRCTCRLSSRDSNSNDDTNAGASISRIVMLAEALFEVLDEIHQQSVVLSSRPSVSSIGSVPAPHEVVEALPVKVYTKSLKLLGDEAAQCYICLVEYEDGDSLRVLPCNHEFHSVCVDKWLKEIHRVCPLCRGDICRSDSLPAED